MNTPGHTPTDIQSHLYLSFLGGHTADVSLCTQGAGWQAVYQLHRVVLIQAGFFHSLFTAGFLESQRRKNSGHGNHFSSPDEVNLRFDDLNITRSAFEICLARLYGGGPELYLSPSLVPTPACPLTPSFCSNTPILRSPPGHHPATPRFLLSLLATSVYLSIPSITSHALSMILSSVGPYTVSRYLNFAIGQGIGPSEADDPEAAVGLEEVGKEFHCQDDSQSYTTDTGTHDDSDDLDVTRKFSCLGFQASGEDSSNTSMHPEEAAFNYGGIGDKVGEACACWLMRWGADMLPYEEDVVSRAEVASEPSTFLYSQANPSRRRATMGSPRYPLTSKVPAPKIWVKGGLPASWVRAVISSNDFFIKDEWERYKFATRVVDIRRRDGLNSSEEKEWAQLFHSIHYLHMSFDELTCISQDTSPSTGKPYVPPETIYSVHWMQSLLRHRIVTRSPVAGTGTGSPPPYRDKELGITCSTADILATLSSNNTSDLERSKLYYPVPVDSSQRIGDTDGAFATATSSADQLLGNASEISHAKQENFFGIFSPHYTATSCIQADATGKARWSLNTPFRFAVEFWGVGQLLEKHRLHSHTIWYAGSLFNVYVQVVRKKGIQLGVYLHRQSSVDPIPRPSAPVSTRADHLLRSSPSARNLPARPHSPGTQSPIPGHRSADSTSSVSSVAFAVPGSPRLSSASPTPSHISPSSTSMSSNTAPLQPYRDPRPSISAYFTISCASATGSSLTRFSSSPDQFSISQSWGWKSSSLRTEEYIELNGGSKARDLSREASLRATVVIGLI